MILFKDDLEEYNYMLLEGFKDDIPELMFALKNFINDPNTHCIIKRYKKTSKFNIFTKGEHAISELKKSKDWNIVPEAEVIYE